MEKVIAQIKVDFWDYNLLFTYRNFLEIALLIFSIPPILVLHKSHVEFTIRKNSLISDLVCLTPSFFKVAVPVESFYFSSTKCSKVLECFAFKMNFVQTKLHLDNIKIYFSQSKMIYPLSRSTLWEMFPTFLSLINYVMPQVINSPSSWICQFFLNHRNHLSYRNVVIHWAFPSFSWFFLQLFILLGKKMIM